MRFDNSLRGSQSIPRTGPPSEANELGHHDPSPGGGAALLRSLRKTEVVTIRIASTGFIGGLPGLIWSKRLLVACGFSICVAVALTAKASATEAEEEDTFTAIALLVVLGTLLLPCCRCSRARSIYLCSIPDPGRVRRYTRWRR